MGSGARQKWLPWQWDGSAKPDTSELENTPNSHVVELWGFLIIYIYIDTELTFDLDNFRLGAFHFSSSTGALPHPYFHWPKQAVASFVFRDRGIVCVESFIVSFSNRRSCLESY